MLPKKNSMVVTGVLCICENKMKKKRISKAHLTLLSIPGLVTPVSGPSETSIPGNRKP